MWGIRSPLSRWTCDLGVFVARGVTTLLGLLLLCAPLVACASSTYPTNLYDCSIVQGGCPDTGGQPQPMSFYTPRCSNTTYWDVPGFNLYQWGSGWICETQNGTPNYYAWTLTPRGPVTCAPDTTLNPWTGMCDPNAVCPISAPPQTPFPASDTCSTSLDQGNGVDITGACKAAKIDLTPAMKAAAACIAKKIGALTKPPISYSGPSATIRTQEYQDHLLDVWTKWDQLHMIMNSAVYTPQIRQACASNYSSALAEKNLHGLKYAPAASKSSAAHVLDNAIDVPMRVIDDMTDQVTTEVTTIIKVNGKNVPVTTITSDIEDYMNSKTVNPSQECNSSPYIYWGGRFNSPDWVHFFVR